MGATKTSITRMAYCHTDDLNVSGVIVVVCVHPDIYHTVFVNSVSGRFGMERRIKCQECEDTYACIKDMGVGLSIFYKYRCEEERCDGVCPVRKEIRGNCYSCRRSVMHIPV